MSDVKWSRGLPPPLAIGDGVHFLARPAGAYDAQVVNLAICPELWPHGKGPWLWVGSASIERGASTRIYRVRADGYTLGPTGDDPSGWDGWEIYPIEDILTEGLPDPKGARPAAVVLPFWRKP